MYIHRQTSTTRIPSRELKNWVTELAKRYVTFAARIFGVRRRVRGGESAGSRLASTLTTKHIRVIYVDTGISG